MRRGPPHQKKNESQNYFLLSNFIKTSKIDKKYFNSVTKKSTPEKIPKIILTSSQMLSKWEKIDYSICANNRRWWNSQDIEECGTKEERGGESIGWRSKIQQGWLWRESCRKQSHGVKMLTMTNKDALCVNMLTNQEDVGRWVLVMLWFDNNLSQY